MVQEGLAVYRVDAAALDALRPDVIITQTQCEVCAVSLREVEDAVCRMVASRPRIVSLEPNALDDILRDLERVAEALAVPELGRALARSCGARMEAVAQRVRTLAVRGRRWRASSGSSRSWPRATGCRRWSSSRVAARSSAQAGKHRPLMTFEELAARDPEVIVVMPCGYDIAARGARLPRSSGSRAGATLRAVRDGRVFVADGNQYFNRPGPRVVESLEILAEIFHGLPYGHERGPREHGTGFERWALPEAAASDNVASTRKVASPPSRYRPKGDVMAQESIRVTAVFPTTAG